MNRTGLWTTEDAHSGKVAAIAWQLRSGNGSRRSLALKKNSVAHLVPNARDRRFAKPKLDLRALNAIVEINEQDMTCTAESGVAFSDLVKATLARGLIPLTVPELKTITIGGAVSGCSVESMSYRYGGFHDSCLEYEVLLGSGDIKTY